MTGGGGWAETGRVTGLLLYEDEGRKVMHLDVGPLCWQRQRHGPFHWPERSRAFQAWLTYANTQPFHATGGTQDINISASMCSGRRRSMQNTTSTGTGTRGLVRQGRDAPDSVGTLFYSGGYVEVLYFLTGEHRAYIRQSGLYDRIVPRQNAFWLKGEDGKPNTHGWGAWQVGLRYNYLNLNDKGINGGVLNDITLGLNWFLNPAIAGRT